MPLPWLHVQHPSGDGTSSDCSYPLNPRLESHRSSKGKSSTYQATGDDLRRYHGELVVFFNEMEGILWGRTAIRTGRHHTALGVLRQQIEARHNQERSGPNQAGRHDGRGPPRGHEIPGSHPKVARVALSRMVQDRGEPIRAFAARLRGQAEVCRFVKKCTGCDVVSNQGEVGSLDDHAHFGK